MLAHKRRSKRRTVRSRPVRLTRAGAAIAMILGLTGLLATPSTSAVAAGAPAARLARIGSAAVATAAEGGYWLTTGTGRVFAFGAARSEGSLARAVNRPVVGLAGMPDGGGYWLVASDGGIFAFGDARFHGSTGNIHLNRPIVGMAATPDGAGDWLVASDGGVFTFGDARFHGSGAAGAANPAVGIAASPDGGGYWLLDTSGTVESFGDAAANGQVGASGSSFSGLSTVPHPFVGHFTANPNALGLAGGAVHLRAAVAGATSCSLAASPSLTGFPRAVSCGSGGPDLAVSVPPNAGSSRVEEFRLLADGPGGASLGAVTQVAQAANFNQAAWLEAPRGDQLQAISCPTSGFCVAVDDRANAIVYRTGHWSAASVALGQSLSTVSCVSPTFCVAGGSYGVDIFQNGAWSAPSGPGVNSQTLSDVSCVSASFCAGSAADLLYVFRNGHWSATQFNSYDQAFITAVSCTSANFCAASITSFGAPATTRFSYWNGTRWSTPGQSMSISAEEITCGAPSMCLVSSGGNTVERFDGTSWSPLSAPLPVQSVVCRSSSFCVAGNNQGGIAVYNGDSWSPVSNSVLLTALSCASSTFCGAVGGLEAIVFNPSQPLVAETSVPAPSGWGSSFARVGCAHDGFCAAATSSDVIDYNGTSWSPPVEVTSQGNLIDAVSCASSSFCAAVDNKGNFFTYDGASWSPPTAIDTGQYPELVALSCPTSTFCVALGANGNAFVRKGSTWTETALGIYPQGPNSLSCVSASFCLAAGPGSADMFNGQSWSPTTIWAAPPSSSIGPVSCVTQDWCEALVLESTSLGGVELVERWNGVQWSWPAGPAPAIGANSLYCATSTVCVAGLSGVLDVELGSNWSPLNALTGSAPILAVACPSANECVGVGTDLVTFDPEIWPVAAQAEPVASLDSISCAPTAFCVAADDGGDVFTHRDGAWSGPTQIETATGGSLLVSCSSSTSCVAADGLGRYLTYNGKSWSWPSFVSPGAGASPLTSLSCASARFCGAVQQIGYPAFGAPATFDGTNWTLYNNLDDDVASVDCVSEKFCAALDTSGRVLFFDGSSWSSPLTVDPQAAANSAAISCTSRTYCVYFNLAYPGFSYYNTYVYDGATWRYVPPLTVPYPSSTVGFSCGAPGFCIAAENANGYFQYYAFNGSRWSAPVSAPYGVTGISCAGTTICAAMDWFNQIHVGTSAT